MIKISARSDKVKGGLCWAQLDPLDEKLVFEKNVKKRLATVWSFSTVLWTTFDGESSECRKKDFRKIFFRARGFCGDSIENEPQVQLRSFKRRSEYQQMVYQWHIKTKKILKKILKKKRGLPLIKKLLFIFHKCFCINGELIFSMIRFRKLEIGRINEFFFSKKKKRRLISFFKKHIINLFSFLFHTTLFNSMMFFFLV